jgi:hypothetical protein
MYNHFGKYFGKNLLAVKILIPILSYSSPRYVPEIRIFMASLLDVPKQSKTAPINRR